MTPSAGQPISDDDLVELANALAGLRHELAGAGVVVPSTIDVDPGQPFGPWQTVVDTVRAGVATLPAPVAGTLLERSVPVAESLAGAVAAAAAAARPAGRGPALDAAVAAAVEDAAALAERAGTDDPGFLLAVESAYASVLAASYATWVVRDLLGRGTAAAGIGLVDGMLRPRAALLRLRADDGAAVVLDVAATLPLDGWRELAGRAARRGDGEAMASVRVRAHAAVSGLGGAEVAQVAGMAPEGVDPDVLGDAALVVGDAAVAAAAAAAAAANGGDGLDADALTDARAAWDDVLRRG